MERRVLVFISVKIVVKEVNVKLSK